MLYFLSTDQPRSFPSTLPQPRPGPDTRCLFGFLVRRRQRGRGEAPNPQAGDNVLFLSALPVGDAGGFLARPFPPQPLTDSNSNANPVGFLFVLKGLQIFCQKSKTNLRDRQSLLATKNLYQCQFCCRFPPCIPKLCSNFENLIFFCCVIASHY